MFWLCCQYEVRRPNMSKAFDCSLVSADVGYRSCGLYLSWELATSVSRAKENDSLSCQSSRGSVKLHMGQKWLRIFSTALLMWMLATSTSENHNLIKEVKKGELPFTPLCWHTWRGVTAPLDVSISWFGKQFLFACDLISGSLLCYRYFMINMW